LKQARGEIQKAVNLQPKNRSHRISLAGVLLDSGEPELALEELRQVESPAMAHYQMAYLHFHRKNVPATQQHLNAALQIDPNLKPARDLLNSMGGAQNVSNMIQQGQQIYQSAGNLVNDLPR
jgi:Tfp pilus assembly protein PilF